MEKETDLVPLYIKKQVNPPIHLSIFVKFGRRLERVPRTDSSPQRYSSSKSRRRVVSRSTSVGSTAVWGSSTGDPSIIRIRSSARR